MSGPIVKRRISSHSAFLTLAIALPSAAGACSMKVPGNTFLSAAASRGVSFDSTRPCFKVSLSDNAIYAPPNVACQVVLLNDKWLTAGVAIQSIQGSGQFSVAVGPKGASITVKASGGFRLDSVTLKIPLDQCGELKVDDVMVGGSLPLSQYDSVPVARAISRQRSV